LRSPSLTSARPQFPSELDRRSSVPAMPFPGRCQYLSIAGCRPRWTLPCRGFLSATGARTALEKSWPATVPGIRKAAAQFQFRSGPSRDCSTAADAPSPPEYGFNRPVEAYLPWYPAIAWCGRIRAASFASAVFDSAAAGQHILQDVPATFHSSAGPRVNVEGRGRPGLPELSFMRRSLRLGSERLQLTTLGRRALVGGSL